MSWQTDAAHASIEFSVRHMMLSKVRGNFGRFNVVVDGNESQPAASSVEVQIDAASINTKMEQRDAHLRSPDFLHVDQFPNITFKSKRIEMIDDSHATVYGDLTIRDVTREVPLMVEYSGRARSPWGQDSVGFTAHTKINREDWNLTWNVALETGGVLVGKEIDINIDLELIKSA
jgi:polyisoprenoid-binding protein YceI